MTNTADVAHQDGKADYSAEVGTLAAAGGDVLVVAGYVDQGGLGVIKAALDTGAFDTFELPDGMYGQSLLDKLGTALDGSYGQHPGSNSDGLPMLKKMGEKSGKFDATSSYTPESYDAMALILLAMQAAKSSDPSKFKEKIMDVANAPGEKIMPGELGKALDLLSQGKDINYEGATGVEFINGGEAAGHYEEFTIKDGKFQTVKYR